MQKKTPLPFNKLLHMHRTIPGFPWLPVPFALALMIFSIVGTSLSCATSDSMATSRFSADTRPQEIPHSTEDLKTGEGLLSNTGGPLVFSEDPPVQPSMVRKSRNPAITRTRYVQLNLDLTAESQSFLRNKASQPKHLTFNLFEGTTLPATIEKIEQKRSGSYSWEGYLGDNKQNRITLIVNKEVLMGNLSMGMKSYQIRFAGNGLYAIHEIDPGKYPSEQSPRSPVPRKNRTK